MKRTIKVVTRGHEWVQLPGTNKKVLAETLTEEDKEIEVFECYEFGLRDSKLVLLKSIIDYETHLTSKEKAEENYRFKCNEWITRLKKENEDIQRTIDYNNQRIKETYKELDALDKEEYQTVEQDCVPKIQNR